ncbi:MAG: DNA methyltransferase [Thermoguttaceae bacterium]
MHEERKQRLAEFVTWIEDHIKGDEKGESQIFLDHLFAAFGRKGVKEAGAVLEYRVKKHSRGGTAFADLVWKPFVLIEMKRRGEKLEKHYRQAFDYWTRLVPGRPRYVALCNFDEFWVYDFETQMDFPVDKLAVADLPSRWGPLAFLFPTDEKPVFGNDHQAVTRKAADRLATCFNKLVCRKVDRGLAKRFILQTLVALFAEDIGLLDEYTLTKLLEECEKPADSYDLLGGLFQAMNTPGGNKGGRFEGVSYFNGGIFADPARINLYPDEISQLREAARFDWSKVRPEIFGALFEHSMEGSERRASGAHFTSPVDIMKIVGPTIVEPWRNEIENTTSLARLRSLLGRMHEYRVLDPACGSGNFLYVAYRELKRLEARIFERMAELSKVNDAAQRMFGFVTAENFFGMDINVFAVELAKVTMMIGRKLAIDELHVTEPALPLDNLDSNFIVGDALVDETGNIRQWPKADVIIGNPPFAGAKFLKPERGPDYVNAIRKLYPQVPGMADYCVYWFRKAHDHLTPCTPEQPLTGRAGLVGTQNVRNNQSRVGSLDHIVHDGTIIEAVDNQPWSGEANVHVSIVNWVKTQDAALLPTKRRLWYKVDPSLPLIEGSADSQGRRETITPSGRRRARKDKSYELDCRQCDQINSALSAQADTSGARILKCNAESHVVSQGITLGHSGFVLSPAERYELIATHRVSSDVIYPYLIGREIVTGLGQPERFVIDFGQMSILDANRYSAAFAHVQKSVLPDIQRRAEKEHKSETAHKDQIQRWWLHWRPRHEFIRRISGLGRYLVCSRVTKRPIFVFVDHGIRPGDALQCFAFADDYSFGILQSDCHWLWFTTKCSKLKSDFRYTPESVFDTFPWPQSPTEKQIDAVAEAGRDVRRIRSDALTKIHGGLRAVYRTLELPGRNPLKEAHAALDAAVLAAYGFSLKKDLLGQILTLNLGVACRLDVDAPVTSPGIPPSHTDPGRLITNDCVQSE